MNKRLNLSSILLITLTMALALSSIYLNQKGKKLLTIHPNSQSLKKINKIAVPFNILTRERIYTEEEITKMDEQNFLSLIQEIERKIPNNREIKNIPEEALQHIPEPVLQAGKGLGLIQDIVRLHTNYAKYTVNLFNNCALNSDTPTAVRAICLTHLIETKRKMNEEISLKNYPNEIVQLTRIVTDI